MARHWCVLVVALALPTLAGPNVRGAEGATREWLRGALQRLEIRLQGEVLEGDGSPATDIEVSGELNAQRGKIPLEAVVNGNKFEASIPVNRLRPYSLWLQATAKDGSRLAIRKLNAFELRQAAIEGIRLTLKAPTRQIEVKVLAEGKPAAGATLKAEMEFGVSVRATADDDGIARLGLLADQTLQGLMAWTDDQIGGFNFYRKPTRDPAANEHVIELSPCRDQTLRFVDESGAPVAGLSFVTQIATPDPDYNYIGVNEHSRMTTNAAGEAVHHGFPDWEKQHFYVDLDSADWIGGNEPQFVDGTFVFQLKRARERRRVRMELQGAELSGLYVYVRSFQGERDNHSDVLSAWTDEEGRYTVDVLPDATYCAHVQDATWVSPMVDVVPYNSASELTTSPELVVSKGQDVEVLVTAGAEKRPYPHLSVGFFREHSYTWHEDGDTRHGTASAQWWATTNASGRAVTRTLPGQLKVKIYTPLWRAEESLEVVPGQRATLQLHCGIDEKRRVTGRLVHADGVDADLAGAEIKWGAVDGKFDEEGTLSCGADGTFAFETAATEIGVFAATPDGREAGAAVTKDLSAPLDVQLVPTIDYDGQLLGDGDAPLAGHAVWATIRVEGDEDYEGMFVKSFDAARIEATTDATGNFTLTHMPTQVKALLRAEPIDDSESRAYLDEVFLEPGEARPRSVHRLEVKAKAVELPLAEKFAKARRDCELLGFRLMVICSTGGEVAENFIDQHLVDYDFNRDVAGFMQVVVSGDGGKLTDEATEFLDEHAWQAPNVGRVAAWALDDQGRELGHVELNVDDPNAGQTAEEFVRLHAPAQVDAAKKWDEAFAEAKRTNRRVWARVSGRYCGPCFLLARWLDDQRELVSKDYVLLKIDDVQDLHGHEVAGRLTLGKHHGVPFHAIFDAAEQLLVDSAGSLGNVGHPSGYEGNKQLRKMLMATRQNLTDAEVEKLVQSVGD